MKKHILFLLILFLGLATFHAQEINILPKASVPSGSYEDRVVVACTFPEGCTGGKYWFNGGQITAKTYEAPLTIETSTRLSVAGTNSEGRIITDVVTYDYTINKVTPPYVTTSPEVNTARESFYVTQILWNNAVSTSLDIEDFKEGGSRYGENVVWLVFEPRHFTVASSDYNGLWKSGTNAFKAYLYNNYRPAATGEYTLHIAPGVFIVDGKRHEEELVLKYFVGEDNMTVPVFSPASGTYEDKVQVSIAYPKSAFYQFYQIEGKNRQVYNGPFTVDESCTITAWGRNEEYTEETEHATATYTVIPSVGRKEVLPRPIFKRNGNKVSISCQAPGAVIKYWHDNHMQNARLYTEALTVDHNGVISAVAYNDNGISPTVDYSISHFQDADTGFGTMLFRTPEDWENVFLTGMSPNGRFVSGYTDTNGTPMAFVWDITSGKGEFVSTNYYSRTTGVSNDGTICGWRVDVDPVTGETISTSDETLFYGYYQNGTWTRQPEGMKVSGITGDNILYGSSNGKPATYNINTKELTLFSKEDGSIDCANADGSTYCGHIYKGGRQVPSYWHKAGSPITISTERECSVTAVSANGLWMLLDNEEWGSYCDIAGYRYSVADSRLEVLTSMGAQYPNRYEWMHSVTDDGTLYGVFDETMMLYESGKALAYTPDGVWHDVADILAERDFAPEGLLLQSCKYVSADHNTFVLTAFPADVPSEEAYTFALALRFNAQLRYAAPVNVKATQLFGVGTVKVSWDAPVMSEEDVASYKVLRNGVLISTEDANTFECYDSNVERNTEYTYTVVAVYADGVESQPSYPSTLTVELKGHSPARELAMRQSGINDINLTWQSPVISIPKLQYFNEENEFSAFGTSGYDSEWAIRIPASEISVYNDMDVRTFQFLPTGPQEGYELRLYTGLSGSSKYDSTPFYTQSIDPATLQYGTVNTIQLTTPQPLPEGKDLLVAVYIAQKGNNNMLGISHEGFRAGYTDLCRVIGIHDQFVSIAQESSVRTEIVVPVGVGLGSTENMKASMVSNYEVSDNGVLVGSTENVAYRLEDVAEGEHRFAVRTLYQDGGYSEPVTLTAQIRKNEAAFIPVSDLNVKVGAEGKASFSWKAPLNDDCTNIHWGDLNPTGGLSYEGYPVFSVASIYPVTKTNAYAGDYEITHLFFYPTADADFRLYLDDNEGAEPFYDDYVWEYELDKLNFVKLPEPITIDQSTNYRLVIDVSGCELGLSPLAFDSSNSSMDGYSNLLNAGNDWMSLNDVLQIDEHPNWLMGMVIRQKNARPMPLQGYNVIVDGIRQNRQLLTDNAFTTGTLSNGSHQATVDVVYDAQRTVKSAVVTFQTEGDPDAIETVKDNDASSTRYDLEGRRIITDKQGRGLYIMNNKKYSAR